MDKKEGAKKSCLQPASKVIVSCRGIDGRENALVVAYGCNCSFDPPMVMIGIVPSRFSYNLIKESKCFVVNLVEKDFKKQYDFLGTVSGRDEDKLKDINTEDGLKVKAPILTDCPVNIECSIVDAIRTGSHEMFIGKVEHVHAKSDLVGKDNKIDFSKIDFI